MFDDIMISKTTSANPGVPVEMVKVPIAYGPSEKWLARLRLDPDLTKPSGVSLPRMAVLMNGLRYDTNRKLGSTNQYVKQGASSSGDPSSAGFVYTPIPMDIFWQLNIMTISTDDANQILEQILPFFTPEWTNRIQVVDELGIDFNVPTIFSNASSTDTYDSGFQERRVLVWTLDFTMKAYFVGPPHIQSNIIKISKADTYINLDADNWSIEANTSPGMLANGSPTSNQAASVSPLTITANDTWDYVIQTIEKTP